MSKKHIFAATLAILLTACFGTVSAGAAPTIIKSGAKAVGQGYVKLDPNDPSVAWVTGRYQCPAGEAHLFVSIKQVADGRPDPRLKLEGSSKYSSGWLERHPGPDEFTCDGTW